MKILHIANINNNSLNGVCTVVPEHIRYQSLWAETALLNIADCKINGLNEQFVYSGGAWTDDVSVDFQQPDLVVFHEVYRLYYLKIAKELRKRHIPYIIVPHGSLVKSAQQHNRIKKWVGNTLCFNTFINGAIALQMLSDNELSNTAFKPKKFIGTNGICISSQRKEKFNDDRLVLTYIGRLDVNVKGLDLLIAAVKEIKDFLLQRKVVINMYGPDFYGRYEQVCNLIFLAQVAEIVKSHHEVVDEEKENNLLASDIFIQTSRHEGMPMGILEAMGYGLPCLISQGTSLGKIVEQYDAGWVAETSVEGIRKAIVKAVTERQLLSEKSMRARKLVAENFSWKKIAEQTIQSYKSLLSSQIIM